MLRACAAASEFSICAGERLDDANSGAKGRTKDEAEAGECRHHRRQPRLLFWWRRPREVGLLNGLSPACCDALSEAAEQRDPRTSPRGYI